MLKIGWLNSVNSTCWKSWWFHPVERMCQLGRWRITVSSVSIAKEMIYLVELDRNGRVLRQKSSKQTYTQIWSCPQIPWIPQRFYCNFGEGQVVLKCTVIWRRVPCTAEFQSFTAAMTLPKFTRLPCGLPVNLPIVPWKSSTPWLSAGGCSIRWRNSLQWPRRSCFNCPYTPLQAHVSRALRLRHSKSPGQCH